MGTERKAQQVPITKRYICIIRLVNRPIITLSHQNVLMKTKNRRSHECVEVDSSKV